MGLEVRVLIWVKVCSSIMISARVLVEVSIMFVVVVVVVVMVGVVIVDWFGVGVCICVRVWALVGDGVRVRAHFVVVVGV